MKKLLKRVGELVSRLGRSTATQLEKIGKANRGQVFLPNYSNMCGECNEWVQYEAADRHSCGGHKP